jgi:hypothetical protein
MEKNSTIKMYSGANGSLFAKFSGIIRHNIKAYLIINFVYYGLVIVGMIAVSRHPTLEQTLRNGIRANFNPQLMQAYADGSVLPAIYLTFVNNFMLASMVAITPPSLVIPFWGVLIGAGRGRAGQARAEMASCLPCNQQGFCM